MKRMLFLALPLLFASLTLGFFLILYHPAAGSPGATSAALVFLTALGWSALIPFGGGDRRGVKTAYAASALLLSFLWVWMLRPFPVDPLQHPLMVLLQALGLVAIVLYLHILKKKGEKTHD
jgi:hypothetical protein